MLRINENSGNFWQNRLRRYFAPDKARDELTKDNHGVPRIIYRKAPAISSLPFFRTGPNIFCGMPGIESIEEDFQYYIPGQNRLKTLLGRCMPRKTDKRLSIFNESREIKTSSDPSYLYISALASAEKMLETLETRGYLKTKPIFQGATPRRVLQELVNENIMNSIEATAIRWKAKGYVGSEVKNLAFIEDNKLWIQTQDNGDGFPEEMLVRIGRESLSNREIESSEGFKMEESLKDHLFKMGQLLDVLGWDLIVENLKSNGASISIVIPLTKAGFSLN
jgi:hypothetical protein